MRLKNNFQFDAANVENAGRLTFALSESDMFVVLLKEKQLCSKILKNKWTTTPSWLVINYVAVNCTMRQKRVRRSSLCWSLSSDYDNLALNKLLKI